MALAWEANVVYGSRLVRPALPDPAARDRFMDLLYGDPARTDGLGLTVARYDIGGGADPDPRPCDRPPDHGLWPRATMEGYLTGPDGRYDWRRDASQRRMLHEAIRRGADTIEAFSNSPPWWMTRSLCVGGADRAREDNLRPDRVDAFASYLATVAAHFDRVEHVHFASVSPVNEPDGSWWVAGNHQEGMFTTLPMQEAVIDALARRLAGTGTIVSGTEPNDYDRMTAWLGAMTPDTRRALGRVNVHQYDGHDPARLQQAVASLGKPLWMSETGCCLVPAPPATAALTMAHWIRTALETMGATVWCFWQPDWGVIDLDGGVPRTLPQFDAIAQFSRFIRPGDRILPTADENVLAARTADLRHVMVVVINGGPAPVDEDVDLAAVAAPNTAVTSARTVTTAPGGLRPGTARVDLRGHLTDREPPSSVTTYVAEARG